MSAAWTTAIVALWIAVMLVAIVLLGVLRRVAAVLERAESHLSSAGGVSLGLPVGSTAEDFRVLSEDGDETRADDLIRAPTLVLFMEVHCGPCQALAKELDGVGDELAELAFFVVLDQEHGRPEWMPAGVQTVFQQDGEVSRAFRNDATPQAYVVDDRRLILGKALIGSLSSLTELAIPHAAKGGDRNRRHAPAEANTSRARP